MLGGGIAGETTDGVLVLHCRSIRGAGGLLAQADRQTPSRTVSLTAGHYLLRVHTNSCPNCDLDGANLDDVLLSGVTWTDGKPSATTDPLGGAAARLVSSHLETLEHLNLPAPTLECGRQTG